MTDNFSGSIKFRLRPALVLPVVLAGVFGCGGASDAVQKKPVFPVKGSVILPDGKPLSGGRIVFVSKTSLESSAGPIGSDGTFTLSSGASGEGAPAGEYKVKIEPAESVVTAAAAKKTSKGIAGVPANLPFPAQYLDEDNSELTATVKAEPNDLPPFKLSKATPGKSKTASRGRDND